MPNFIGIYPKAFSDELCDDYVEWFKQKHKKFGTVNKQNGRDDVSIFAVNHGSAEELNNKARAILKDNHSDIEDGIGDAVVVLTNLAELQGTTIEACIDRAYNEIKDRTGKMSNGTFKKD